MMEFILSKVTLISSSTTLLKMTIIPGQHQDFCLFLRVQIEILKIFKTF